MDAKQAVRMSNGMCADPNALERCVDISAAGPALSADKVRHPDDEDSYAGALAATKGRIGPSMLGPVGIIGPG